MNIFRDMKTVMALSLTLVLGGTISASAQTPLLWYKMDDGSGTTVTDSGSGTALNGTLTGTATWSSNTPSGTGSGVSLTSDGTDANAITTGSVANTKIDKLTQFTLTLWVNLQAAPAVADRFVSILELNTAKGFDLEIQAPSSGTLSAGNFRPTLLVDGFGGVTASANTGADNQWLFLAVTYDGSLTSGNVKFYTGNQAAVVAQLGATQTLNSGQVDSSTGLFQVGNTSASSSDRTASSLFDDVRIYGSVLTSSDLESIRMESVPEPSVLSLTLVAMIGGACLRRRLRRQVA